MTDPATIPEPFMRLAQAAAASGIPEACLITEARRGRLDCAIIAGKRFTTLSAVQRMFDRCLNATKAPASTFDPPAATPPDGSSSRLDGSSATVDVNSAHAAALEIALALKNSSPGISPKNTRRRASNVISIRSRCPT